MYMVEPSHLEYYYCPTNNCCKSYYEDEIVLDQNPGLEIGVQVLNTLFRVYVTILDKRNEGFFAFFMSFCPLKGSIQSILDVWVLEGSSQFFHVDVRFYYAYIIHIFSQNAICTKAKQKMAIYQIAISYKVLPHANNIIDFYKKSKFFNTFLKMSSMYQK